MVVVINIVKQSKTPNANQMEHGVLTREYIWQEYCVIENVRQSTLHPAPYIVHTFTKKWIKMNVWHEHWKIHSNKNTIQLPRVRSSFAFLHWSRLIIDFEFLYSYPNRSIQPCLVQMLKLHKTWWWTVALKVFLSMTFRCSRSLNISSNKS